MVSRSCLLITDTDRPITLLLLGSLVTAGCARTDQVRGKVSTLGAKTVFIRGGIVLALTVGLVGAVPLAAQAALPAGPSVTGVTGSRPNATRLTFPITDAVVATVDVGTGNLNVAVQALSLPGATNPVVIGDTYNSRSQTTGSTTTSYANDWTFGFAGAGNLTQVSSGVVYTGGDGSTWLFTPVSGSTTTFNAPAGLNASLVFTSGTGYTLTLTASQTVVSFDTSGNALSVADKNSNTATIGYSTGLQPTSVVGTAGSTAARTAALAFNPSLNTLTATQTNGTLARSVKFIKSASSDLTSFVDAENNNTTFGYGTSGMTSITSPRGGVTNFTYDTSGKISRIDRLNTTTGSAGTSTTRLTYPTTTQTLLAGPNTSTSTAVATGDHTTYTLDATKRVTGVTDEMGRVRAKTYTPNFDTATATNGSGSTANTTTGTYGANTGKSLTSLQAPAGATSQAAYANTSPPSQYLPSSTTDSAGNQSVYTYNGTGNTLTSSDATAATATLTYNSDGTVATALAPGNGTNKTTYGYNTTHQLTSLTPPTGSSLGAKALTYDGFGRLKTTTDGRGTTLTYGYDKIDHLLTTAFSDTTPTVTNTYNANGQLTNRVDGSGTTTYVNDQLGQLIRTTNTAGGGTINYGYDKASNLTSTTDSRGTTTNTFDVSGTVTSMIYPKAGGTQTLLFATDDHGRRTDEWMQSNATHTTWAAHVHTDYDQSGRVDNVIAETGTGDASHTTVLNQQYCYNTVGGPGAGGDPGVCLVSTASDQSKLQWTENTLTGASSSYTYDAAGRLKKVTQAGTGANTYTYSYDSKGNRLTAVVTGATPSSQTFTANAANQIKTTGYTYDGTGNMTADPTGTYTYNGAQQMTSAVIGANTTTYTYGGTAQNEVLSESGPGGTYHLTYGRSDSQGQPIIEQYSANAGTAYVESDPKTGQPLMLHTSNDIAALYVYDGTGSPVGLLTDFGSTAFITSFDPYGVPALTAGGTGSGYQQNPYVFKGGVQSRATGWVHYGARWYNPATGRFTQQDTLDIPLDPANANRYAYAADDPINLSDPKGQLTDEQCDALRIASEAIGAAGAITALVGGVLIEAPPIAAAVEAVGLGLLAGGAVDVVAIDYICSFG